MDQSGGLTPGDPLGGSPERPAGYGAGPVPPGAVAPRPPRPAAPPGVPASLGRRALALAIDAVMLLVIAFVLVAVVGGLLSDDSAADEPGTSLIVLGVLISLLIAYPVAALLYLTIPMAATDGKTLGKLLAGIRVVRDDGRRVGFWWAVYREVVIKGVVLGTAAALTGGIAYLVDLLWPVWERENRTLHDLVVDSRVVRG
jgi:uncharacterized RDD family membrane protein YckC